MTAVVTIFTSATTSAVTSPTVNGSVAVTLNNTSSFIGTVFLETSLDGALTWIRPATPLTTGTMVAGPLTFSFGANGPGPAYTIQHRLNVSAYTSGTLTAVVAEATVPDSYSTPVLAAAGAMGVFPGGILGSITNDSASAGEIGEYQQNIMGTVSATGIANTGTNGPAVASPVVMTLTALDTGATFANLQSVFLTGTVGTGLVANTNYFVCNFNPVTLTFNIASTLAKAVAVQLGTGVPDMNVTVVGSGTTTIHQGSYATSTNAADIIGLQLSAGDWDVDAMVFPVYVSSASVTAWQVWLAQIGASAAPATSALCFAQGLNQSQVATANTANTTGLWTTSGTLRISLSAAGYVALAYVATFSAAQINPQGFIRARRVR